MKQFYRGIAMACVLLLSAGVAYADCVSGNVSAEFQVSGPHAGLWKYTLDITWDLPKGISNVTLDCGWDCDPVKACDQTYEFDSPAGTGNPCSDYDGEFNCNGNPSIGFEGPIVKWDVEGCDAKTGSAQLCFFTNLPPLPDSPLPVTLVKNGQNVCEETLTGDCPALCPVPVKDQNWGRLKGNYKK